MNVKVWFPHPPLRFVKRHKYVLTGQEPVYVKTFSRDLKLGYVTPTTLQCLKCRGLMLMRLLLHISAKWSSGPTNSMQTIN